jgi:hypothetical protein
MPAKCSPSSCARAQIKARHCSKTYGGVAVEGNNTGFGCSLVTSTFSTGSLAVSRSGDKSLAAKKKNSASLLKKKGLRVRDLLRGSRAGCGLLERRPSWGRERSCGEVNDVAESEVVWAGWQSGDIVRGDGGRTVCCCGSCSSVQALSC